MGAILIHKDSRGNLQLRRIPYEEEVNLHLAVDELRNKGKDAQVVIYPGVGRGFDFRNGERRKFADDLAAKDALIRSYLFIRKHLGTQ